MLKITNTTDIESRTLLEAVKFGHLGCSKDDQPYIVPMHYAFDGENIYFFTTEGMKTEWLDANPKVCLQVEHIDDDRHWRSVIIMGKAERLTNAEEIGRAANFIVKHHASLTPALNKTIIENQERSGSAVVYRLHPDSITGRKTYL
jgi:nitroimidazol reductase NimA-like FMN-containing flavoprotein (pyridoxamine 5'-phosphate oxidase superfamily)